MQHTDESSDQLGLLALGVSGRWHIDVDECIDSNEYLMELDGPQFYFVFKLSSLESVTNMARYLEEGLRLKKEGQLRIGDNNGMTIGRYDSSSVSLNWDDEESVRCFLVAHSDGKPAMAMRFMFDESDVTDVLAALDQVLGDLS
jgi:hypothetical protein